MLDNAIHWAAWPNRGDRERCRLRGRWSELHHGDNDFVGWWIMQSSPDFELRWREMPYSA
jgi:hypothetical protein